MPLRVTALGGSIGTPADGIEAEVVEVRSFEQLQQLGDAARGKLVFFNRPMPRALRARRPGLRRSGAAAQQRRDRGRQGRRVGALVRSMTTAIDAHPHTGVMHYDPKVPKVPAAAIATPTPNGWRQLLQRGPVRVRSARLRDAARAPGANVVGELRRRFARRDRRRRWPPRRLGSRPRRARRRRRRRARARGGAAAAGLRHPPALHDPRRAVRQRGERAARRPRLRRRARDELGEHVAAIESDSGGFAPSGFSTSLRDDAPTAFAACSRRCRSSAPARCCRGLAPAAPTSRRCTPRACRASALVVDGQRYFDYHHSALDDLAAVNERELALGAAVVAYAASVLADR
jgi:carboxypeptidase Q